MPAPRAVLDTNVIVSALLGKGPSARLYEAFKEGRFWFISSNSLIAELADVLLRPELSIPSNDVKTAFRLLRQKALIIQPTHRLNVCRDPKDNFVLECALSGDADCIVTGDLDLLVLDPWQRIRIISPSAFLKCLPT